MRHLSRRGGSWLSAILRSSPRAIQRCTWRCSFGSTRAGMSRRSLNLSLPCGRWRSTRYCGFARVTSRSSATAARRMAWMRSAVTPAALLRVAENRRARIEEIAAFLPRRARPGIGSQGRRARCVRRGRGACRAEAIHHLANVVAQVVERCHLPAGRRAAPEASRL